MNLNTPLRHLYLFQKRSPAFFLYDLASTFELGRSATINSRNSYTTTPLPSGYSISLHIILTCVLTAHQNITMDTLDCISHIGFSPSCSRTYFLQYSVFLKKIHVWTFGRRKPIFRLWRSAPWITTPS